MIKKFMCKCFISLGFLLFFTVSLAQAAPPGIAKASVVVEKEKNDDYRLNLRSITLVKGKTFTLKAYNLGENAKVNFKSAGPEIASVSEDGTITANMVGFTTITATIKDGTYTSSLTCDVTVGPPAFSVKMTRSRIILGVEKSDTLSVIKKPSNTAEDPRFSSYDSSIASISTGGRVTGRKIGYTYLFAEIDATNSDGSRKFAVCSVIVVNPEDVSTLESYFNDHPELNLVSDYDLSIALEKFFNSTSDTAAPATKASDVVTALGQYLDDQFNLAALRKEIAAITTTNQ